MKNIVEIQTKKVKIFDNNLRLTLDVQSGFILGFLIGGERHKNTQQTSYDIFIFVPFLAITFTIAKNHKVKTAGGEL